jgi:hypothetical protein
MNNFNGISNPHTTNLAVVAPGIAEALLATAFGLAAAIPAVMIYNAFARAIANLSRRESRPRKPRSESVAGPRRSVDARCGAGRHAMRIRLDQMRSRRPENNVTLRARTTSHINVG